MCHVAHNRFAAFALSSVGFAAPTSLLTANTGGILLSLGCLAGGFPVRVGFRQNGKLPP